MGTDAFTLRAAALLGVAGALLFAPAAHAAVPNDPLFAKQWQLAAPGVLGASAAWGQALGDGVTVAVLDTGARLTHPDLAPNLWTNPGEIAGNGVDDDHDGFVDDVHGADLVNDDGDPSDDEGHGTHVAGIIGARGDNAIGISGIAPRVTLMIVKVLDDHRNGTAGTVAEGIRYAVAHGASVVNTSVNGDGPSAPLEDAIQAAAAAGVTIVASAGNDHRNLDAQPSYPVSYPDANVIGVGSIAEDGTLSAFSNVGSAVDVAAPGENITSTARSGGYELRSGTSMAAPEVSGALALAQSAGATQPAARAAILSTRRALPGGGFTLDVAAALRAIVPMDSWQGSAMPLAITVDGPARRQAGRVVLRWSLSGQQAGVAGVQIEVDGRPRGEPVAAALTTRVVHLGAGRHTIRIAALDAADDELAVGSGAFSLAKAPAPVRATAATSRRGR